MYTLVGFSENIDQGNVLANIAAVVDDTHRVTGDFVFLSTFNNLVGVAGYLGILGTRLQLQSPSLRLVVLPDISPVALATSPADHDAVHLFGGSPIPLATNEGLEALALADPVAPEQQSIVAFISDGVIAPVSGQIFTLRATAAINGAVGSWASGALTFDQTLPVGRYQIVGTRVEGAGVVAFRYIGIGAINRPGGIALPDAVSREHPAFRRGGWGVWMEFDSTTPPSLEILSGAASAAQVVYIDIVKVG